MRRRVRDERGAVTTLVATLVMSGVLFGIAALVVDLGLARDTRQASQIASDASALAAANALYPITKCKNPSGTQPPCFTDAVAAAKSYATANYAVTTTSWGACTDTAHLTYTPDATTPCISFDSATKPTKVRVQMPTRKVPASFAVTAGVSEIPISSSAGATVEKLAKQPCGFCVLGEGTHNFQNGDVTVTNADIYINGSSDVSSNGLIASNGKIFVENNASGPMSSYQPDPTTHVPPLADPLGGLGLPPDMSSLVARTNPCTDGPGIYTGQALNNKVCTLQPGLYVIRDGIWDGSGNQSGELKGTGVTLYFTCSSGNAVSPCASGQAGARLDASGNYKVSITAPTSGPLRGLALAYDRNNTSMLRLTGNGSGSFTGAIYAKSALLQLNGNGCASPYNSLIVVDNVDMNGNPTCIQANYDVSQNPDPPPGNLSLYQ